MIKHVLTLQDFIDNPELEEAGYAINEEVNLAKPKKKKDSNITNTEGDVPPKPPQKP